MFSSGRSIGNSHKLHYLISIEDNVRIPELHQVVMVGSNNSEANPINRACPICQGLQIVAAS